MRSLDESYDHFPLIEAEFQAALDESLDPRGPDSLYDIVAGLGLPAGASVLDLGCGEGEQSVELARRFAFRVTGVDPVERNVELATSALAEVPEMRDLVSYRLGFAEAIPLEDASIDLIWSREVFVLIEALDKAFAECRRVLRPGGRMMLYQMFNGERITLEESQHLWDSQRAVSTSADIGSIEASFTAAGFKVERQVDFECEWGEYAEEKSGSGRRRLLHAARLLRDPQRYIDRFGQANYDIMLGDCLWHVYRMIGKLTGRAYVLRAPG